jgi:hypothetical protein
VGAVGTSGSFPKVSNDSVQLLSADQKSKILQSCDLIAMLKSKRLRDELISIDSSEDRQAQLKQSRQNPEFESFITLVLEAISE